MKKVIIILRGGTGENEKFLCKTYFHFSVVLLGSETVERKAINVKLLKLLLGWQGVQNFWEMQTFFEFDISLILIVIEK